MLLKSYKRGLLFAPVGAAGAGGAGNGGGNGESGSLNMESIMAEVDKRVGNRITASLETFAKDTLARSFDERINPLNASLAAINEALGKLAPANPQQNNGGGGNGSGNSSVPPEVNVQLKQLLETTKNQSAALETLKKEKMEADQRAERSERHSIIKGALNSLHFTSDAAGSTAFTIVEPHIKRLDDGNLIGGINGDNFPVEAFVKDYLTKEHPYLLRGTGASGSGAPNGSGGVRMGVKADLGDIKVGMKPETRESIVASIGAALANT